MEKKVENEYINNVFNKFKNIFISKPVSGNVVNNYTI